MLTPKKEKERLTLLPSHSLFPPQVLIKPKPVTFQATVVSEQTRQLVTETLQQASRVVEAGSALLPEVKEEPQAYADSSSSSTESSQGSQGPAPTDVSPLGEGAGGVALLQRALGELIRNGNLGSACVALSALNLR